MTQMEIVHSFVLRIALARLARASNEARQRAAGSEHADQLGCEQPGRLTIQIVDQVPAENPVDACVRLPGTNLQDPCDRCRLCSALPGEAVEIREEILDKNLTPEPLTEKVMFGPTTGPRSSRIGESRSPRLERNVRRALVGRTGAASGTAASTVNDRVDSGRRTPRRKTESAMARTVPSPDKASPHVSGAGTPRATAGLGPGLVPGCSRP